ncbi:MAG: HEAT repeat domain-containing protein [Candidatus Omnitrophica bacterium]|nr:HEAT repeat domain-containing protein [Candidatus Omnitrophota bacterium]
MTVENRGPIVAITYDTIRFLGECTGVVEKTFFTIAPFLKPRITEKPKVSYKSPEPEKSPSSFLRSDKIVTTSFATEKKEEANPILLSFQAQIDKPASSAVASKSTELKNIPFQDADEAHRADIYVRDFDSKLAKLRSEALDQIKKLSKPVAIAILKKLLATENDQLKLIEILNALSTLNEKADLNKDFFIVYLKDDNPHMRLAALRAISKYKDEEAFEILSSAIKDPSPEVRKQALNLICWNYGDRGIPFIMKLLHDVDDNIRKSAIQMCGAFRAHQAVSALISLLTDAEQTIQKEADAALRKITKHNFEFHAKGSQKNKEEAIEAWRFWWINNQATFGMQKKNQSIKIEENTEEEQGGGLCLKSLY